MAKFTDAEGRAWTLRIVHSHVARIKDAVGVSLYHLFDNQLRDLAALMGDPDKLVCVAWILVEAAAEKLCVTPESFGGSLDGNALEAMGEAFLEALADFFPNRREALLRLAAKGKETQQKLAAKMVTTIDRLDADKVAADLLANGAATKS